jgi:hypothetical protein
MNDLHDTFKKMQEMAASRGVTANIVWYDEDGAPSFLKLDEAHLVIQEPNHPTLFEIDGSHEPL